MSSLELVASRIRRERFQRVFFTCILMGILVLTLASVSSGFASPATTLAISPKLIGKAPNESFSVGVTVSDVSELYTWQFNMSFNPDVLEAVSVVEGPFLKQAGTTMMAGKIINNSTGSVQAGWALFPYPDPTQGGHGANGDGVLASITFRVKAEGESALHFSLTDTKLRSWDGTVLVPIAYAAVDGAFEYPLTAYFVHDVAVSVAVASPLSVLPGGAVSINVTVVNNGNATETFDVILAYGYVVVGTQRVTNLDPETSKVLIFTWDTREVPVGDYVLTATANTIAGETNTVDNVYSNIDVKVTASSTFPLDLILISVVAIVVVVGTGTFLFMKRRAGKV